MINISKSILPILTIEDASWAKELALCLVDNGITQLEITLRTPQSWDAVEKVRAVQGISLGVGSVSNLHDLKKAYALGVQFAVSPGLNQSLVKEAQNLGITYIPGVATATEIMTAIELGFTTVKWFPAEILGGIPALRGISAPFPNIKFIPTGGITAELARNYLKETCVLAVGGSWMFPQGLMEKKDLSGLAMCFNSAKIDTAQA